MSENEVTQLLRALGSGQSGAQDALIAALYSELRRLAGFLMWKERPNHTLQPTALVNEAYMRLVQTESKWENRAHFHAAAARAMRRILVEHARQKGARKRGGEAHQTTFADVQVQVSDPQLDILALDEALNALAAEEPRLVQVVELRYFAGCSQDEAAELLGVSEATVKRDWAYARAWLYEYMSR